MVKIIEIIATDILRDISEYIVPSTIFGILITVIIEYEKNLNMVGILKKIKINFIKDKRYKWKLLFFIYIYFILEKTLLDRSFGATNNLKLALTIPNIFEINNARDNIEAIENLIFFIPYTFFLLQGFKLEKLKNIKNILILGFLTSLLIEVLQFLTNLGTFQLSDLLYNTLGGLIGYILYKLKLLYLCEGLVYGREKYKDKRFDNKKL